MVIVVENDFVVFFAAIVKLPTPKGLVKFGSVPYSNKAQPPVPLELMLPFSTALVLAIEVAARVVTAGGALVEACASSFLYEIRSGIPTSTSVWSRIFKVNPTPASRPPNSCHHGA